MINIGINGFGRIGRLVCRKSLTDNNIRVVAINNRSMSIEDMIYYFKYDSAHGKFKGDVYRKDDKLVINDNEISVYNESNPVSIPWDNNIDCIIESTGAFTTFEKASVHLRNNIKKVIITSPSSDVPMYVYGVNHVTYDNSINIVSNASCTTNALAPLVKVIDNNFGLIEGLMTTIHASTASQNVVDNRNYKNPRMGRSALNNVIPTSSGAVKAMRAIIPSTDGKLTGMAFRIPTINVSVIDLSFRTYKKTSIQEIKDIFKKASENSNIIGYSDEKLVSTDYIGDERSVIFDANSCVSVGDNFFKIIGWYDNEWGYSCRVLDLINYMFR